MHEAVGEQVHLLLEVGGGVVVVAVRHEDVHEEHADERRHEALVEGVGDEPLLHGEDELAVAVVAVAPLADRLVVEDARHFRVISMRNVSVAYALLVVLGGDRVRAAAQRRVLHELLRQHLRHVASRSSSAIDVPTTPLSIQPRKLWPSRPQTSSPLCTRVS